MEKLGKQYRQLEDVKNQIDDLIESLEEKRNAVEDKALDRGRDMTEKEQEKYDALDNQINCLQEAIGDIESAMYQIEEFWSEEA